MAAGTASAAPPGGGDAPEDATAGTGAGAPVGVGGLAAARAAAILAATSQIPGADGVGIDDMVNIGDYTSLLPTSTVLAIVFCVGMMLAAFAAGWWSRGEAEARAKAATLRPAIASAHSSSPVPPVAYPRSICTTKSGRYWRLDEKCQFFHLSSAILERSSCPVCVDKSSRHRASLVAATPRDRDE